MRDMLHLFKGLGWYPSLSYDVEGFALCSAISMDNASYNLSNLTVNRSFMQLLLASDTPCCGLGLVEVDQQKCGFIALRPGDIIPPASLAQGFRLGHSLYGSGQFEVLHFSFEFYDFGVYHVLVNPSNNAVRVVLETMIEGGDYFFFSIEENSGSVTAFRNEIDTEVLGNIKLNWPRIQASNTTTRQHLEALTTFIQDPIYPIGKLMHWVSLDSLSYLDLRVDRLDLTPSGL